MLKGLRTVKYPVRDLDRAKAWYTELVGHGPYFDQPFYVGFDVGGYELGLVPADAADVPGFSGAVAYWGFDDADAALAKLVAMGGKVQEPIQDVGEGIRIGAVLDPDGNAVGVIFNPHFRAK